MSDTWQNMIQMDDSEARMETLVEIIQHEIETDDENWARKGLNIAKALAKNDAAALLIALCGWSADSLAIKSFMLCDEKQEFDNGDEDGFFVAKWSDGEVTECNCKISPITHEVTGVEYALIRWNTEAHIIDTRVHFAPVSDWAEFSCIPEQERGDNKVCFWYKEV